MTTDEQKIKVIEKELRDWDGHRFKDEVAKAILDSLKQFEPEPLEVRINRGFYDDKIKNWDFRITIVGAFDTEQAAIDLCNKNGMRVKK